MTGIEIANLLTARFGDQLIAVFPEDRHPRVHLAVQNWPAVADFLRNDPVIAMDWLCCLTGIDYVATDQMAVLYDLKSTTQGHRFAVKVFAPRKTPVFPSMINHWPGADWHEREAFDLLGIVFEGHPDLRRILLSDDWVGHPLLKDYEFPREYHGIPASVELDWQQSKA